MGLGQIFCRQYIKGVLLMILEGLFIFFLAVAGVSNIIGLFTLGTVEGVPMMGIEGDNSVAMLTWGIVTIFLCLLFVLAYYANIKDIIFTTGEIRKGKKVKTFFESCSALVNGKFYFLTLTVPLVFVLIFNWRFKLKHIPNEQDMSDFCRTLKFYERNKDYLNRSE